MNQGPLTLGRWLRDRARTTPDRVAIDERDQLTTYAELDSRSERLAGALLDSGLRRGDLVATLTANSGEHVVVFFACAKAGLGLVPLSWRLAAPELAFQLDDAEPVVLIVDGEQAALADEVLAEGAAKPRRVAFGELEADRDALEAPVDDDDTLLVVYTSGTTGRPKGAQLTHANCFWTNLSFDLATGVRGEDVVLQVLPQFHCGGWNVQPLLAWWKGARVVLERTFDAARCLELIERKRVTTMMGVPAIYQFMAEEPAFEDADLSSLRSAVVGGAPMPEPLLRRWQERRVAVVQGYGLTEAAPNVLCLPPEDAVRKAGWAGKPYPFVDVRLSPQGELQVQGPNVFAGYWRNSAATTAVFDDGWLRTGDVAEQDDEGNYRIRGRLKDMYISGGENVYPAEIESVLHEHPAVADAAVVGVPDERWGESGVAFVVTRAEVTSEELRDWCGDRLARYKVPREVRFLEELPRSAMNKVLKDELAASLQGEPVR
ncbi:MAG: acyl-CoA synthetase [Gaiellaceae bacterium]